ncbi:site-specific integrase [Pseudoalteromonas sp. MM17-2]|uniref:site-specific integrase n=1 Tax=Pseudoalteromonas sp. MM17-2 TaxID=2917753 RepID=UPI001EF463B7|nr:site-specific integrase [Pseudoalteromonas sp. MM17-2]MCG7546255.1 site-specific integrase [Pseudoalteromonas sp. MM17-2]
MALSKLSSYLYQYSNSKNYFFRIRRVHFQKIGYYPPDRGYFVKSLQTDQHDEAIFLAAFIVREIFSEVSDMERRHSTVIQQASFTGIEEAMAIANAKHQLHSYLHERTAHYLGVAKTLLYSHLVDGESLGKFRAPSERATERYCSQLSNKQGQMHNPIAMQHADGLYKGIPEANQPQLKTEALTLDAWFAQRMIKSLSELGKRVMRFDDELPTDLSLQPNDAEEFGDLVNGLRQFSRTVRRVDDAAREKKVKYRLKETYERYVREKQGSVGKSSLEQYKKSFEVLIDYLGKDFDLARMDTETVTEIKVHLLDMVTGRGGKPAAPKTLNKYLINYNTLFIWCKKNLDFANGEVFRGRMFPENTSVRPWRRQFDTDELQAMLEHNMSSREAKGFKEASTWFTRIAMFTGLRLNEIAVLQVRDVRCTDGVDYLDLTDHHLKSQRARRVVPIHSKLIALGFLEYVRSIKENGYSQLFPELISSIDVKKEDEPGDPVGDWFNRTCLRKIGIDKAAELARGHIVDFHCFRTTVVKRFKHQGVDAYIVRQLMGHEDPNDVTFGGYGAGEYTCLEKLSEVIELLAPDVDVTRLKKVK